jgi:mannitol/fructose-specific phosphotransferase system IIA component (Ntr-type)
MTETGIFSRVATGIAIPHCCCAGITTMAGAIGISQAGIEYDALVFMLVLTNI